jgi:hypothetical protein
MYRAYRPIMSITRGLEDDLDGGVLGPFALDHVIDTELPDSLGTVDAPAKYVVTAVFSRRPDPIELELLASPEVGEQLALAGYPGVTLTATDRRLSIGNTDLHELEGGLARTIGVILARIGERVALSRFTREAGREDVSERELNRAASVWSVAKRISFDPHESHYR